MTRGRPRATGAALLIAVLGSLWSVPSRAQTPAGTGSADLTLPPEWRHGPVAEPRLPASPPSRARRASTAPRKPAGERSVVGGSTAGSAPVHAGPEHPVDLGVVMRGGSATPRVYGQTGTAQPLQESGSAFGAGMRVGF